MLDGVAYFLLRLSNQYLKAVTIHPVITGPMMVKKINSIGITPTSVEITAGRASDALIIAPKCKITLRCKSLIISYYISIKINKFSIIYRKLF